MYTLDERSAVRRPHENPAIQRLYEAWLGKVRPRLCVCVGGVVRLGRCGEGVRARPSVQKEEVAHATPHAHRAAAAQLAPGA